MIAARFHQVARQYPRDPALLTADAGTSYAELAALAARARSGFERRGIRPGGFVAISLPAGLTAAATFLACAQAGAVYVPVNPGWRVPELAWLLEQTRPAAAIIRRGEADLWSAAGFPTQATLFSDDEQWLGDEQTGSRADWPPSHPAACVVSSGSSGRPKIAVKTHGGITGTAAGVAELIGFGHGHRLLATVPPYHGSGLANNLILPLLSGGTLVCLERFEPAAAAAMIEAREVDYLVASPVIYSLLIDANIPPAALRTLRVCLSGGAPLPPSVADEWMRRHANPIRQAYGSSEAGMITIDGHPVPGNDIRILNGEEEQAPGEIGEIALQGPGVVTRYLGESEPPAGRFWNGYLRTGDLGRMDDGGRLHLAGRARAWINSGGVKIDPAEVQQVISRMPGVRECMVEAAPGPGGRDVVAAVIAPEPGVEITRAEVLRHCRESLAEFKIPRVVQFVPHLATSLTGKRPAQGLVR